MKLCIVGTGYVGLVSGTCFAETGNEVTCVDIDASKIAELEAGRLPIYEPGLEELVLANVTAGRLRFSTDIAEAVANAVVSFVAVGTPPRSDGGADLSAVDRVAERVAAHVAEESVLVMKSTVPVGTNARMRRIVAGARHRVHVVSNPEFLREGEAVADFLRPDRVVIGCDEDDEFARDIMTRLYHPFSLSKDRVVWMDPVSAELTKYVANSMLAMRISFMNEVATLCERVGADVHLVRQGVGSDNRIGARFLYAGPGYGGSCFPKDVAALTHTAREQGMELELVSATERVNARQKGVLARKLKHHFEGDLRGKIVAIWGIAFKPRTDDVRESAALPLIEALVAEGATVRLHDPEALKNAVALFGERVTLCDDDYEAARDADALVLVTEWRQYQNPDFRRLKTLMRHPYLLDGRNIWSGYGLRAQGFVYEGIGVRGS
ncbi:MAG: UDP-glucose/GDP-mannose dehydrogenase family protein [Polyangiaceae bacterium]|nr:UDP-glucose/GDP-mannose dehydrogenase family protein [Polyangiaceae bacterium]